MRSIEPGISRNNFEVPGSRSRAPRNDGEGRYSPNTIFATMSRWISEEPPKMV